MTQAQEPAGDTGTGTGTGADDITILSGAPTAGELAALSAVVSALAEELADDGHVSRVGASSAWQRSQRALRAPLTPGRGAWRSFSG